MQPPVFERRRHKKSLSESNIGVVDEHERGNEKPISFGNFFLSSSGTNLKNLENEKPDQLPQRGIISNSSQTTRASYSARKLKVKKPLASENDLFSFLASPSSEEETKPTKEEKKVSKNETEVFFKEEINLSKEKKQKGALETENHHSVIDLISGEAENSFPFRLTSANSIDKGSFVNLGTGSQWENDGIPNNEMELGMSQHILRHSHSYSLQENEGKSSFFGKVPVL